MSDDVASLPTHAGWTWQVTNYARQPDPNQPAPGGALSWVRCSVQGRAGATVHVVAADTPAAGSPVSLTASTGSRPEFGPFFCELGPLPAGHYTLTVDGIDAAVALWLDGSASATVTFEPLNAVLPPSPAPRLPHVLFLGQLMAHQGNFLALTRYVACFGAVVTFDPQEAARAEHVILIGSTQLVDAGVEQQLRAAGCRVERVQGDIAAQLDGAVASGSPFVVV